MTKLPVKVKRIGNHTLPLPKYETEGAAGFDLRASLTDAVMLPKHGTAATIGCGFAFEVPPGHELQVRPRSGLTKAGVAVSLGTVDSDYRGEVKVHLRLVGAESFVIRDGDRIAQGVIAPVVRAELVESEELSETARGGNGFGSTGNS